MIAAKSTYLLIALTSSSTIITTAFCLLAINLLFCLCFVIKYIKKGMIFGRSRTTAVKENETDTSSGISGRLSTWIDEKQFTRANLTLEIVAGELHTNRTYLSKHINTHLNKNFKEWIRDLRIHEALRLIEKQTDLSYMQIGEMVGIPDKSSFYRQFSLVTKMTPGRYKKQCHTATRKK